jgi:hypothetical protein
MSSDYTKYTWFKNASNEQWVTPHGHRGYSGQIDLTFPAGVATYTLTIAGSEDAPVAYPTLKAAKVGFGRFLRTQPLLNSYLIQESGDGYITQESGYRIAI